MPIKGEEQQASALVFRARDLLARQRTQCINALRRHLAEFGWVVPKGVPHVARIARIEDSSEALPLAARPILLTLVASLRALESQVAELDVQIAQRAKADPVARRLLTIPGVGPITATAITVLAPPAEAFTGGRHFAAWVGLTPKERSTEAEARRHLQDGRENLAAAADHRDQRRREASGAAWCARGVVAGADAGAQAEDAGHRRPGQQDRPHRLGALAHPISQTSFAPEPPVSRSMTRRRPVPGGMNVKVAEAAPAANGRPRERGLPIIALLVLRR